MRLWLKNILFTVIFPGTVTVGIPFRFLVEWKWPNDPVRFLFGGVPILLGVSVYVWCVWDFAARGRGTPFPLDPPKTLRTHGLYRFCRNPMYLGVLQVVLGIAILFESLPALGYVGVLFLVFHAWALFYEEPFLLKKFGTAYADYCRKTPRWIPAHNERKDSDAS